MILADHQIKRLAIDNEMIRPFKWESPPGEISSGLTSFGYDVTLGTDFKLITDIHQQIVDPKNINPKNYYEFQAETEVVIPPGGFLLGTTVEYFKIPDDLLVVCVGKSTYARCGLIVNVTPIEPGFEGQVTLEVHNTTSLPAKIYPKEGICQFLFFRGEVCEKSYKDKAGKYQGQIGVTLPRM